MYSQNNIVKNLSIVAALAFFGVLQPTHGQCPQICDGNQNSTALVDSALSSLTTSTNNTSIGWFALSTNTTGGGNTAVGSRALFTNTGGGNTATGYTALYGNTTGSNNTAN